MAQNQPWYQTVARDAAVPNIAEFNPCTLLEDAELIPRCAAAATRVLSIILGESPMPRGARLPADAATGPVLITSSAPDSILPAIDPKVERVMLRTPALRDRTSKDFSMVLFHGTQRKRGMAVDQQELWRIEEGLMKDISAPNGPIHLYVVLELPDGNYVNLVLGDALKPGQMPRTLMRGCPHHEPATASISPNTYSAVRINSGTFCGSIAAAQGCCRFQRTLCLFWGDDDDDISPEQRAVRGSKWKIYQSHDDYIDAFPTKALAALAVPPPPVVMSTQKLRCVSCMGHNAAPFYRQLFELVGGRLGLEIELLDPEVIYRRGPWQSLIDNTADVVAMCGVEFGTSYFNNVPDAAVDLLPESVANCVPLVAPVRKQGSLSAPPTVLTQDGASYQGLPVYFSALVIPKATAVNAIDDLKGFTFVHNGRCSWSGYRVVSTVVTRLCCRSSVDELFGSVEEGVGHVANIKRIATFNNSDDDGLPPCAAVDSVVLDMAVAQDPTLLDRIHIVPGGVIPGLGSGAWYPMPPIVGRRGLPGQLLAAVAGAMAAMDLSSEGSALMNEAGFERLAPASALPYRIFRELEDPPQMP